MNSFRPGYFVKDCKGSRCQRGQNKHNTLLYFEKVESYNTLVATPSQETETVMSYYTGIKDDRVLSTTSVLVASSKEQFKLARMVFNQCSQTGFISKELCNSLNLQKILIWFVWDKLGWITMVWFIVTILLKGNLSNLGESKEKSMRRFLQLEERLERKPKLEKE